MSENIIRTKENSSKTEEIKMTNAQIIYNESMNLMKQGIIGTTGRVFEAVMADGSRITVQEPEEIHTYAAWKSRGYQVQKGQKAVASFAIWKHTVKKAKNDDEEDKESMFLKVSSFFSRSQVAPIAAEA